MTTENLLSRLATPGRVETSDDLAATREEVIAWFFDDYLKRWVAASSGASGEGPEFVLDYWGVPMSVTALGEALWLLDAEGVLGFLAVNQEPLRAQGYTHTVVPDRRVFAYNTVGAAVEVIWSRRRADQSEIQRWAVHFEVMRGAQGWRVVGVQSIAAQSNSLAEIWPR
jgi:hypothetical protein